MEGGNLDIRSILPNEITNQILYWAIAFPESRKFCDLKNCKKQTINLLLSCKLFNQLLVTMKMGVDLTLVNILQRIDSAAKKRNTLIKELSTSKTDFDDYTIIGMTLQTITDSPEKILQLHKDLKNWHNPNQKDGKFNRPLYYAIYNDSCPTNVIRSLVEEYGTEVNDIDSEGHTALQVVQELEATKNNDRTKELIRLFTEIRNEK
jgi:hypothetical protein